MLHEKDQRKDIIYKRAISKLTDAQSDMFKSDSTLTGYVVPEMVEKLFERVRDMADPSICVITDYGECVDHIVDTYGLNAKFKLIPTSPFGYQMSLKSVERYTENPEDFVIFNSEKYSSLTLDKYFEYIMKSEDMFDVCVGNPPYGKGRGEIHLQIFKTALEYCNDKLCFIMPSKPIVQQLKPKWYDVFKNAVCTDIEVIDKSAFKGTNMDNTAIYYCDVTIPEDEIEDKYCKKLDVDDVLYTVIDNAGKLFIDKMNEISDNHITISYIFVNKTYYDDNYNTLLNGVKDDCYYLNVNRAGVKPDQKGETQWLSGEFQKIGVLTKDEELEFCKNNTNVKNIIECPNKEYAENLKHLMVDCKVLKFGLWLLQKSQNINSPEFKYVPNLDYTNIHNDSELLTACGFTPDEITKVLDYLKDFDFSRNRNDVVRGTEKSVED